MEVSFVGQGLQESDESVGRLLIESLGDQDFDRFSCIVAFASVPGISYIRPYVEGAKGHINTFSVVVGVDQKGTTKEALESLLDWEIGAKVYHTRSNPTFHPKVYLFEGKGVVRIIVGSNNLTVPGLFQNVEAAIVIKYTRPDEFGESLLEEIQSYFEPLLSGSGGNVQTLTRDLIETLHQEGIIEDEEERAERSGSTGPSEPTRGETGGDGGEILELFPTIDVQTPPSRPTSPDISAEDALTGTGTDIEELEGIDRGDLVWLKEDLPRSDAQDVSTGTNVTGQLRFAQANWEVGGVVIDQTRYFRHDIFGDADWVRNNGEELAQVWFDVTLNGDELGLHRLQLIHKPEWEAEQRNVTTMLRWGELMDEVRSRSLTGKDLYLYESENGGEPYSIIIE